ncbi:MAG: helix-turn-helix transcriptional regulator [Chloroflexota bacterium]
MLRASGSPRRGVNVRAGAVREARLATGLTLAALASNQVSRQAVHQVESGRVRPTLPLLNLIA